MENLMNLSQEQTIGIFDKGLLTEGVSTGFNSMNSGGSVDLQLGCYDYWPYYQTYHHYYPLPTFVTPNKTETAYKVVKVLLEKKLAKVSTVKELVTLIDAIVAVV